MRDLVIGIAAALTDGTTVRGGGKVVKNVAGYDLMKLMSARSARSPSSSR